MRQRDGPMYDEIDDGYDSDYGYDHDDDASDDTIDCPNCGDAMFDDAPQCPHCGHYLTAADRKQLPPWIWWAVVLAIVAMLLPFLLVLWKSLAGP